MWALITLGVMFGGVITLFVIIGVKMSKPGTGTHVAGPYIPAGNPFRIGNTVLICEDVTRPEMNWYGTVLATRGMQLTVRDNSAPYSSVDLEKAFVYPAGTNLGW